jgi:hypothetical protein
MSQVPKALGGNERQADRGALRGRGFLLEVAVTFSMSKAMLNAKKVRPNTSLKLTRNGRALWPHAARFAHFAACGHSALPSRAP